MKENTVISLLPSSLSSELFLINCFCTQSVAFVELLLDQGANPNKENKSGLNAVHLATLKGFHLCCETFLRSHLSYSL